MTAKFTAYFESDSMEGLYAAMTEAAGRAVRYAIGPGSIVIRPPVPTVERHDAVAAPVYAHDSSAQPSDLAAPKKRGRKPGTKMGPYKKEGHHEESSEAEEIEEAPETEALHGGSAGMPASANAPDLGSSPTSPSPPRLKAATLDDVVAALKLVNSVKNVDAARAALEHFGAKRCGDLAEANRGLFIAYCEKVANG
jgi:hypothetical protein